MSSSSSPTHGVILGAVRIRAASVFALELVGVAVVTVGVVGDIADLSAASAEGIVPAAIHTLPPAPLVLTQGQ